MVNSAEIFRGFDKSGLDREYDNLAKVADVASISERWTENGRFARESMSCRLEIPYGAHERHKLDFFPAMSPGAPILVFLHGGYWHSRDKSLVHFIAPLYVAAGVNVISVGYRLCPEVGIEDIVEDVRAALGWIHENASTLDADPRRLFVAGHSAGGHLAALMCGPMGMRPGIISGGCSISGLHDLEPIRMSYLNKTLGLDRKTVEKFSPVVLAKALMPSDGQAITSLPPLILTVGGDEGQEYLRQRDDLVAALRAAKQPVSVVENPGNNHFTACDAFCDPAHPLSDAMLRLIFAPRFSQGSGAWRP